MSNDRSETSIRAFLTPPHACAYLEGEQARSLFLDPETRVSAALYQGLTERGFRRSGDAVYRPHCDRCSACQPSRLAIARFQASRAQRRTLSKNADIEFVAEEARFDDAIFGLYDRYITARHQDGSMYPATEEQFRSFLLTPWAETSFYSGYLEGQRVCVAVTDHLPSALSAVYTFFEPELANRGLGTLAVLAQIHWAKALNLEYLYLGYAIEPAEKMRYKFSFRPLEVLGPSGWTDFTPATR